MSEAAKTQPAAAPDAQKQRRELVPVPLAHGVMAPSNLTEAIEVAKLIAHSGMTPKQYEGNPGAVLVAIQMGAELGLSPMSSIQNIAVINGRPSIWGDAMLALVIAHADCEDVVEDLDEKTMTARCSVKRRGRSPVVRAFSMEDAKQAGLAGKQGPWSQYPKRMLAMRARSWALRDAFPDALRGIVSREESSDIVVQRAEFVDDAGAPVEGVHRFDGRTKPRAVESAPAATIEAALEHTAAASTAPAATEEPAPATTGTEEPAGGQQQLGGKKRGW